MRHLLIGLASLLMVTTANAQTTETAADTVNKLHAALLKNMQEAKSLGCAGRVANMKSVVGTSFDLPFLAKHIVRKHWAEQSEPQQQDFLFALEEMIVTTYASQFASFNGEKFVTLKTDDLASGRNLVHSQLQIPGNAPVNFDYILRQTDSHWRIVNVIAEGVSDLAIRSQQYDRVIKEKGFVGLLAQLKKQNNQINATCQLPAAATP
jgi:phospholipid transport system substrate-binding protein